MTYVGQKPATTFDSGIHDRFTGTTGTTVTLSNDIATENDIIVFVNAVKQDSNNYSVGGTGNKTLTLGGTLVSADIVEVHYLNKVLQSVNPTANSVGITELNVSDGSNGQALTTNGSGTLSFASAGASLTGSTNNTVTTVTGANAIQGEANLTFDGTNLDLPDNVKARFGTGNDLQLYHTGSDSVIASTNERMILQASDYLIANADNSVGRMIINSSGEVSVNPNQAAIGTTAFVIKGAVNNNVSKYYHDNTSGNETLFTFYDGDNTACGSITIDTSANSVAYNTTSDYRVKENETAITDGIDRVKQLKPYKFNFKADPDKTLDGFFAHEVSSIVPEAISGTKDGFEKYREHQEKPDDKNVGDFKLDKNGDKIPEYQQIDQAKLVPLLTSALQEAITKIETLETKVTALENK